MNDKIFLLFDRPTSASLVASLDLLFHSKSDDFEQLTVKKFTKSSMSSWNNWELGKFKSEGPNGISSKASWKHCSDNNLSEKFLSAFRWIFTFEQSSSTMGFEPVPSSFRPEFYALVHRRCLVFSFILFGNEPWSSSYILSSTPHHLPWTCRVKPPRRGAVSATLGGIHWVQKGVTNLSSSPSPLVWISSPLSLE